MEEIVANTLKNYFGNLPEPTPLQLPLSNYMMKPYPERNLTVEERVFNYWLSRMRRIPENGFGILANRWRFFRRPFSLQPWTKINGKTAKFAGK